AQVDAAFVRHFEKEQIGQLLDVVAVVDAVVAQGVAEAPKFLDDIAHAAMASLNWRTSFGSAPWKTLLARPKPPARSKMGNVLKSSSSMERFSMQWARMRSNHWRCSPVKVLPSVTWSKAEATRSSAVSRGDPLSAACLTIEMMSASALT